jgi:hypothetical protein
MQEHLINKSLSLAGMVYWVGGGSGLMKKNFAIRYYQM